MLCVGDIEKRKRGVAKVNKDKDRFLEDLTVSSMWIGTVGRSDGTAGGSQEGEGGWAEMKAG